MTPVSGSSFNHAVSSFYENRHSDTWMFDSYRCLNLTWDRDGLANITLNGLIANHYCASRSAEFR